MIELNIKWPCFFSIMKAMEEICPITLFFTESSNMEATEMFSVVLLGIE